MGGSAAASSDVRASGLTPTVCFRLELASDGLCLQLVTLEPLIAQAQGQEGRHAETCPQTHSCDALGVRWSR
jgi:hypothetical protein